MSRPALTYFHVERGEHRGLYVALHGHHTFLAAPHQINIEIPDRPAIHMLLHDVKPLVILGRWHYFGTEIEATP